MVHMAGLGCADALPDLGQGREAVAWGVDCRHVCVCIGPPCRGLDLATEKGCMNRYFNHRLCTPWAMYVQLGCRIRARKKNTNRGAAWGGCVLGKYREVGGDPTHPDAPTVAVAGLTPACTLCTRVYGTCGGPGGS